MKKVVNVSVGGRSFSLDEDAYARLLTYFDHFKARLDRDTQSAKEEVMADLENRIAELFDQGTGGASYRVVNLALVTKVVEQLGMPDGSKEPESGADGQEQSQGNEADDEYPKSGSAAEPARPAAAHRRRPCRARRVPVLRDGGSGRGISG